MKKRESIMHNTNKENCFICGQYASECHHALHGTANRRLADEDGLTVMLCRRCHANLHDKGSFDRELQRLAQLRWMEYYNKTADEFRKRYGKNYL